MNPVFRLDRISKRYRGQVALDDVSLEAAPGTVVALLGENGAGKTTALRILLGLVEPDDGQATVLGFDCRAEGQEIRRRVGYVPEQSALYEWMTVAEIGWFTAGFFGGSFLPRYGALVDRFELPRDRKLKALSKGMRAKVCLALAMAPEPALLVLDEPTSGLDAIVRREFLESMVDVAATGRTVLLSSHQIVEVERVADVVAILREGRLVLVEPLEDLKDSIHEVTLSLRNGELPVSDLPGTIIHQQLQDRQWRLLVRGASQPELDALRSHEAVADLESRRPSLEEIFVAYMRPGTQSPEKRPTGDVST